jgi:hypothetical protein
MCRHHCLPAGIIRVVLVRRMTPAPLYIVAPAKAGAQGSNRRALRLWMPAFAGMTARSVVANIRSILPVVVEQIDARGVALLKAKDNPLVGADSDAPITRQVARQPMQSEAGQSSCSGRVSSSSLAKNAVDLVGMIRPEPSAADP